MKAWQRQHRVFLTLLLVIFLLSGVMALRYERTWDVTQNQRNQLADVSVTVAKQLRSPVHITAFSRGNVKVKAHINRLLSRYRPYADIQWTFKNPDTDIDSVRQYAISREGDLVLTYESQSLVVSTLNETAITRGLYRLLQGKTRRVLFLSGHGERDFSDEATGYSQLQKRLARLDIVFNRLDSQRIETIPDNIDLLVLASPKHPYDAKTIEKITDYLKAGGRLLWLASQDGDSEQIGLSRLLGARFASGWLVGQAGKTYGLNDPAYVPLLPPDTTANATSSVATLWQGIETLLVFPKSSPIHILPTSDAATWSVSPLLSPVGDDWYLKSDNTISQAQKPLYIGVLLTAKTTFEHTKVWLIGDGDFASNRFIGQGQNGDFAVNLISQLAAPDAKHIVIASEIPPPVVLTQETLARLALLLIVGVPVLILLLGYYIRRRGRQ